LTKVARLSIIKLSRDGGRLGKPLPEQLMMKKNLKEEGMSGEDKAVGFFGDHIDSLKAFESLKIYINDFCPDAVISIQGSLLSFRTGAGFAYVSLPADDSQKVLFNLAITNRKKIVSDRIEKTVPPVPGTRSFVYHIGIRSASDIDSEIKGWIRQSYEYSKLNYA
jgi:hypothetical protein